MVHDREKRVGDLVREAGEPGLINSGSLIVEAVTRLGRRIAQGEPGLLLVTRRKDNQREVLGTVTLDGILSHLEPPNLSEENELPIFWEGQLGEQARRLFSREVDVVMVEPELALNQRSTLMEALHLMNSKDARVLVVVDDDQVVGLLTREHLYRQIVELADES